MWGSLRSFLRTKPNSELVDLNSSEGRANLTLFFKTSLL